jgi:hypothetical protein
VLLALSDGLQELGLELGRAHEQLVRLHLQGVTVLDEAKQVSG